MQQHWSRWLLNPVAFVLIIFTILAIWFCVGFWGPALFLSERSDRGLWGDQFGSVNALFSSLAFAALLLTVVLQSRDLAIQQNQLKQSNEDNIKHESLRQRHVRIDALTTILNFHYAEYERHEAERARFRDLGQGNGHKWYDHHRSRRDAHSAAVQHYRTILNHELEQLGVEPFSISDEVQNITNGET